MIEVEIGETMKKRKSLGKMSESSRVIQKTYMIIVS